MAPISDETMRVASSSSDASERASRSSSGFAGSPALASAVVHGVEALHQRRVRELARGQLRGGDLSAV